MWTGGWQQMPGGWAFWRPGEKKVLSVNIIARLVHGLFWRVSSPKRRIPKSKKPSLITMDDDFG